MPEVQNQSVSRAMPSKLWSRSFPHLCQLLVASDVSNVCLYLYMIFSVYVDSLLFTSNDAQGLQSYLSRTSLLILSPVTSRNHKPSKCLSGRHLLKSHHTDTAQRESMSPSFTKVTLWGTHGSILIWGEQPLLLLPLMPSAAALLQSTRLGWGCRPIA